MRQYLIGSWSNADEYDYSGEVAFKAGEEYWFHMNGSGEISRTTDKGVHMFRASGVDGWTNYFEHVLEDTE